MLQKSIFLDKNSLIIEMFFFKISKENNLIFSA